MSEEQITSFSGKYSFLSNFYPIDVYYDGDYYKSAEHAYVAAKTTNRDMRSNIRQITSPGKVKKFGRVFKIRDDWEEVKINEMRKILISKFRKTALYDYDYSENLFPLLKETGNALLIEGNTWGDIFWVSVL